jgi:hypothetical protein
MNSLPHNPTTAKGRYLAIQAITYLCLVYSVGAASVGPAGYTNDLAMRPVAEDFSTSSGIAGGSGDIASAAALDIYVQNVAASDITAQVADSSPTNPPSRLGAAQWTSGGSAYLVTRPTGNLATLLLATLVNNTGTNCNMLQFGYRLTVAVSSTEQIPGQRLYYSFSTLSNTWTTLPAVSGLNTSGLVSTNVLLGRVWTNGTPLYLMWVDDNSSSSTESAYVIDDFFASTYYTNPPLTITLTAPANGQHFGSGDGILASVGLTGFPTNVSYYVDDSLAAERTTAPFTPVTLPSLALGPHTLYATAEDGNNGFVTTTTNAFTVAVGLAGTLLSDTTLYASNSPYTVTSNLFVPTGVTLAVEPGVTVNLRRNCGITVSGRLLADGTTNLPISFTRYPGDLNWERILFVKADDSRFRNCVFEYANCAGDHKYAYYATNCAYPMNVAPRNYFEAVVALACHLDFEGCLFTNLFTSDGSLPEGDAIGIFSDDLVHRGPASANIRGCQFRYIGQGVNTRYAYVLVENCYFVGKTGDNDDVELYGESTLYGLPTPEVRNNFFDIPCYDDRIHPTRCSAIIHDNVIYGDPSHGDHCIVLRDTCCPIVFNNVLFNSPSGGISIQNGCDALIANNIFYGINSAIKLFDHRDRIVYPYCLSSMSGRATVINCIMWNGNNAVDVSGSAGLPFTTFRVDLSYCDIQGGTNSIATGSNPNYSVVWGPGIINTNPLFVDAANRNLRLATNSPCIDAGSPDLGVYVTTNTYFEGTSRLTYAVTNDLGLFVTHDLDAVPRPLDGDGDGMVGFDLGSFEVLHATADSNNDGIPDAWCQRYGLSPIASNMADEDPDHDGQSNRQEYLAGTDPTNATSYPVFAVPLGISIVERDGTIAWTNASPAGVISILTTTNLMAPWQPRENYFTTNPVGQARLKQMSDPTFCKLLATDISTNTPVHYANLLQSYGVLETVAGRGLSNSDTSQWQPGYEGDWATNVCLSRPHIAFGDSRGNVLIVDQRSSSVLKVTPEGRLYTYAGTHIAGSNGDGPDYATNLHLNNPNGGWLGTNDVFYVLDTDNAKVRRISPEGIMTTLFTTTPMGDGRALWVKSDESAIYFGSGDTATNLNKWTAEGGVTLVRNDFKELGNIVGDERTGNLFISDRGANRVYRLAPNGVLTPIAGNGTTSGGGDGFAALETGLIAPRCVALLPNGGWFTSEHSPGNRIWYVDPAGIIHRWVNGDDANNFRVGDGHWFYENPATPKVSRVRSVIPDPFGHLIIVESNYGYVRRIKFQRMAP